MRRTPSFVRPCFRDCIKRCLLSDGTMVTADDQYLRDSILQPGKQISAGDDNIMPSFAGHLSEEEIMQLIAYLKGHRKSAASVAMNTSTSHPEPIKSATELIVSSPVNLRERLPQRTPRASARVVTKDHKRIGLLYLFTILVFFLIASVAAAIMRIELLTPQPNSSRRKLAQQAFHHPRRLNGLVLSHTINSDRSRQFHSTDDDRGA